MQEEIWGCQYYVSRLCIYYQGISYSYSVEKKWKGELECVRGIKWVRGKLKASALYDNSVAINAVATTWTLLSGAQSWV